MLRCKSPRIQILGGCAENLAKLSVEVVLGSPDPATLLLPPISDTFRILDPVSECFYAFVGEVFDWCPQGSCKISTTVPWTCHSDFRRKYLESGQASNVLVVDFPAGMCCCHGEVCSG